MRKIKSTYKKLYSQLDLPYLETNYKFLPDIFNILEQNFGLKRNSKQSLIDLGAGNGNIIIYSALNYGIKSFGIEINQNLIKEIKSKIKSMKKERIYDKKLLEKIHIIFGDLFNHNLNVYDFVYIYSFPPMQKYLKHVFDSVKKGAIIISHKYPLKNFNSIMDSKYIHTHFDNVQKIFSYFYMKR